MVQQRVVAAMRLALLVLSPTAAPASPALQKTTCEDNPSYKDPLFTTNQRWEGDCPGFLTIDEHGPAGCDDPRYVTECGYTPEQIDVVKKQCPDTCALSECHAVSMGGDPIFHNGDQWLKFRLKNENQMVELLSWSRPSGKVYTLLGSTFSSRMKGADQWFNKLAISANGHVVLDVEIGAASGTHPHTPLSQTMKVKVDGHHLTEPSVYTHEGKFQVTLHQRKRSPAIGEHMAERIRLHWGQGEEFEISSAAAIAFPKHPDLQEKWAHLNLHFDGLPSGSSGLLAELAGLSEMSSKVRALLVSPHKPARSPLREHGVSLRRKAPKASDNCPVLCPGCPLALDCEAMATQVELLTFWADENEDFNVDVDEFEAMCEDNPFLAATAEAHSDQRCAAFTNYFFALCDNDESGDLDGCEGLACMVLIENMYRSNNCPDFPAASVDACSANDCVYGLKPDYETMFPSFKDCKSKLPLQHIDWDVYDKGFSEVDDPAPAAFPASLRETVGDDSLRQVGAPPGAEHASVGGGAYMPPGAKLERVITWSGTSLSRMRGQVVKLSKFNHTHVRGFFQTMMETKSKRNVA